MLERRLTARFAVKLLSFDWGKGKTGAACRRGDAGSSAAGQGEKPSGGAA